jgi:hypothetical protein
MDTQGSLCNVFSLVLQWLLDCCSNLTDKKCPKLHWTHICNRIGYGVTVLISCSISRIAKNMEKKIVLILYRSDLHFTALGRAALTLKLRRWVGHRVGIGSEMYTEIWWRNPLGKRVLDRQETGGDSIKINLRMGVGWGYPGSCPLMGRVVPLGSAAVVLCLNAFLYNFVDFVMSKTSS